MSRRLLAAALATLLVYPASLSWAEGELDPQEFCRRAGRNQAIFEMLPAAATAQPGKEAGAVACSWVFEQMGHGEIVVRLDSKLLASPLAARQTILLARLPENHRGQTIEPLPRLGDDGLSRVIVEKGVTKRFELEAVKGRRHFLLTLQSRNGAELNYRVTGASIDFLGSGIAAL